MNVAKSKAENQRVVSGVRSTGRLHLGNYHGAIKHWLSLQHEYHCLFFAADWHALTTDYETPHQVEKSTWEMMEDWLAAGLNPKSCHMFIQSRVPEHAELHLLLSMLTPLSWLERMPTFKDQQEKLKEKDLSTYGFLGYPLLQSADVLIYKAGFVPVGEDQVAHIELTREVARRFNYLYGREADFEEKALAGVAKMGKKSAKLFKNLVKRYQESGDQDAIAQGHALLADQGNLSIGDRERLQGYLEGTGKIILPEPQALLSSVPKMPGLDGQKMSKSYNNTIGLTEDAQSVEQKLKTMQTDPARVRRTDAGDPEKCPVWQLHQVYSSSDVKAWVQQGCTTAGIGCLDCKGPLIDAIKAEQDPIRERAQEYRNNPKLVRNIVLEGCEEARYIAKNTLQEVKEAIGLA